jgi:hypothetical protein
MTELGQDPTASNNPSPSFAQSFRIFGDGLDNRPQLLDLANPNPTDLVVTQTKNALFLTVKYKTC